MKFKDFEYLRPDFNEYEEQAKIQLDLVNTGKSLEEEIIAIDVLQKLEDDITSMITLAEIRNSVNTQDEFYENEQEFLDENTPRLQAVSNELTIKLLNSKHRKALEKHYGKLLFEQAEVAQKTFNVSIIEDLQLENKLATEYSKLTASAKIEFEDGVYNLSQMAPFTQSTDRTTRKKASLAVSKFFNDNVEAFDRIYGDLVNVRNNIAKKLGYESFVQLGYDRLGRTDYNSKDVNNYRSQILTEVVPIVTELTNRKTNRLKIDNAQSYDLSLSFLSGNPTPKGDRAWQVSQAKKMYEDMSTETGKFFNMMIEQELLELDSKPGKSGGGYCTYIPKYNVPYIFANFNGTAHDVDVLTHEAGHAFQVYQSKDLIPAYRWPTMEAAEIHSMSMEFLAWPWIENFFKEDTAKYKYEHLAGAVSFLPYGALVDHFQHEVYGNPSLTGKERRTLWRRLEREYLPFKKYDEDQFLNDGGFFFRQGHIFESPFYYIDYTLAQVCAFQYWSMSQQDFKKAWSSYLDLCKQGGSKSFLGLVEHAKLISPFSNGAIDKIMEPVNKYLKSIDDSKL